MSKYFPLHLHTSFSIGDAVPMPDEYAEYLESKGFKGGGIADHGSLSGILKWQEEFLKRNLVPLIGIEAYVVDNYLKSKSRWHLTFYFRSLASYKYYLKLHKKAYTEGFYYKPRILLSDVIEMGLRLSNERPILLSGCVYSPLKDNPKLMEKFLEAYEDDFYLELSFEPSELRQEWNPVLLKLGQRYNAKFVFTLDSHYLRKSDELLRRIVNAIAYNKKLSNEPENEYLFVLDIEDVQKLWKEVYHYVPKKILKQAIENTFEVMEKCKDFRLPRYDFADLLLDYKYEDFIYSIEKNLDKIDLSNSAYLERLDKELKVIKEKRFWSYFLTVKDIIDYARKKRILVGPGRGSVGGSLIAYLLGITSFDPLKYNLFFERFISPDRVEPPDIDVDFQDNRRDEVIAYIKKKYGEESVAQIVTFSYWKEKQIVRDLSRITGMNASFLSQFPEYLAKAGEALIGKIRHRSKHAAGIVLAKEALHNYIPVETVGGVPVVAFDKYDIEKTGLIKFDVLGLSTLSVIDDTFKLRNKKVINPFLQLEKYIDVKDIYDEVYNEKRLAGIFQFDTGSALNILEQIRIDSFEDIVLINALNRPGPLSSFLEDIVYWKNNKKFKRNYPDWIMNIVKDTGGVFIFQEQIMELCRVLEFDEFEVNAIRKAISKSKMDVLKKYKHRFIEAVKAKGYDEAEQLWEDIVSFGGYAFNKSHAVAYSLISFMTALLKYRSPAEFYVALIKKEFENHKKLGSIIKEMMNSGIKVVGPTIKRPVVFAEKIDDNKVQLGLAVIKGVGVKAAEKIISHAPYSDIVDFARRSKVSSKVVGALALAGVFDDWGYSRKYIYKNSKELKKNNILIVDKQEEWDDKTKFKKMVQVLEFIKYL